MASNRHTEARSQRIIVRVTEDEKKAIQTACKSKGVTVADVLRKAIQREVQKWQREQSG